MRRTKSRAWQSARCRRADTGGLAWWGVTDASTNRQLGCLVLNGHTDKTDGAVVLVSQARPCGVTQTPTTPVGHTPVQSP